MLIMVACYISVRDVLDCGATRQYIIHIWDSRRAIDVTRDFGHHYARSLWLTSVSGILDGILLLWGNCLVANQGGIFATNSSEGLGKNMVNLEEK